MEIDGLLRDPQWARGRRFLLLQFVNPHVLVRMSLASQEDVEGKVRIVDDSRRAAE